MMNHGDKIKENLTVLKTVSDRLRLSIGNCPNRVVLRLTNISNPCQRTYAHSSSVWFYADKKRGDMTKYVSVPKCNATNFANGNITGQKIFRLSHGLCE